MKTVRILFLAFLVFFLSSSFLFASGVSVESRIQQVTVYPDSALISRVTELKLNPGQQQIIFPDIIPELDENSLRVSATDTVNVKILGAQVKKEFLEEEAAEAVKKLQEEIQGLEDGVVKLENDKKILSDEKQFLDSIRLFSNVQIPKDLVTKTPSAQELDATYKFLDVKLKENLAQVMDTELKTRETRKKIEALRRELSQISGPQKKLKRSIIVDLEVLRSTSLDLKVSYLVRGAFWQPIYDARADFGKSEVEMVSYGIARQKTGEDWQDVEISLSTAKPTIGGRMPYVSPWLLRPYQPRPMEKLAMKRAALDIGGQFQAFAPTEITRDEQEKEEAKYAAVEEKGIAVVYKLLKKATIKSDGSEHKLPISAQILKADFEYSTYPRLAPYAYLGSRVTNAKDLQLLAGRVNIFLEDDFVGTSSIDNIGPQEEFDLYLGVDENVKVKREQVEKKVDDVLIAGIPAPNRRTTYKYKITIENYKGKRIKVILFEALPVSEDEKIKVKIVSASLEPKEKNWKDRKGIWRWEVELEPKQKQEIFYNFIVEHPRELQVEGL